MANSRRLGYRPHSWGLGLNLGKICFNLAGEYVLFGDKDIKEYYLPTDSETGTYENYAGLYKFNAIVITLGTQISL